MNEWLLTPDCFGLLPSTRAHASPFIRAHPCRAHPCISVGSDPLLTRAPFCPRATVAEREKLKAGPLWIPGDEGFDRQPQATVLREALELTLRFITTWLKTKIGISLFQITNDKTCISSSTYRRGSCKTCLIYIFIRWDINSTSLFDTFDTKNEKGNLASVFTGKGLNVEFLSAVEKISKE